MPGDGQIALLLGAVLIFIAAGALSLARRRGGGNRLRIAAKALIYWGILTALGTLVWHSIQRASWIPLDDNFDALISLGILLAGFVLYMQWRRPIPGLDWFMMPIAVLMLISAAIFGRFRPDAYRSHQLWFQVHLLSSFGGAAAFAVAAAVGSMYLVVSARLRRKTALPGPNLGNLERLEHVTQASAALGFALLTLGMITGIVRAIDDPQSKLGPHWMASPKVVLAFCVWVVYAMALHTPITPAVRGRRSAMLSIVGFVLMFGTIVAMQFIPGRALMDRLLLLGLNHTTAPLEVREKLAFDTAQRAQALAAFKARFNACEAVLLSTCNRVEIYLSRDAATHPGPQELAGFLAELRGLPIEAFSSHLYEKSDREVASHLFAVASSLDSMVLGETQILGQVREAYEAARAAQLTGPMLHPLFQRAFAVGKRVMNETALAEGRVSVASIAVDYARKIFDSFSDKTVLSIGAGKMAHLVLQHLSALPGALLVCNRDSEKAVLLAQKCGGTPVPFDKLPEHLATADIVVSSTGSAQPIITRKMFDGVMKRRRYKPMFLIDIALPRDIEPSIGKLENVYLYNLDDLQQVVNSTHSSRKGAIDAASRIVQENVEQFALWHRARQLGPAIDQLYRKYHALADDELSRMMQKLPNLSPQEQEHLRELTRRIVNKFLHDPMQTLRQADNGHAPPAQYLHALQMLFKLDEKGQDEGDASKSEEPSP